jgi:hypothetical protein
MVMCLRTPFSQLSTRRTHQARRSGARGAGRGEGMLLSFSKRDKIEDLGLYVDIVVVVDILVVVDVLIVDDIKH